MKTKTLARHDGEFFFPVGLFDIQAKLVSGKERRELLKKFEEMEQLEKLEKKQQKQLEQSREKRRKLSEDFQQLKERLEHLQKRWEEFPKQLKKNPSQKKLQALLKIFNENGEKLDKVFGEVDKEFSSFPTELKRMMKNINEFPRKLFFTPMFPAKIVCEVLDVRTPRELVKFAKEKKLFDDRAKNLSIPVSKNKTSQLFSVYEVARLAELIKASWKELVHSIPEATEEEMRELEEEFSPVIPFSKRR